MYAVILAGGLGTRLQPFTKVIPKPLLPIGESSVLEIQIKSLVAHGFKKIFIATNYMAKYIETFLGDGSEYGVKLEYSKETKPLGTCGPVTLLKKDLKRPFILMNGDVLTTLDFSKLYNFGLNTPANLTVVTKEIVTPFEFGKIISRGKYIRRIEEKPDIKNEILAGIYFLKPALFKIIPKNTYYGIDSLIKDMLIKKMPVAKYRTKSYWLDIGRVNDYKKAQDAYETHFTKFVEI